MGRRPNWVDVERAADLGELRALREQNLEQARKRALSLFADGVSKNEIGRILGVSPRRIGQWLPPGATP